jgi:hypothetical protein
MILHPLFIVPADVPEHVLRAFLPWAPVIPNVYPIRKPVLVADRIVALLRAYLPYLASHGA